MMYDSIKFILSGITRWGDDNKKWLKPLMYTILGVSILLTTVITPIIHFTNLSDKRDIETLSMMYKNTSVECIWYDPDTYRVSDRILIGCRPNMPIKKSYYGPYDFKECPFCKRKILKLSRVELTVNKEIFYPEMK